MDIGYHGPFDQALLSHSLSNLQEPLILERRGIKIGFLGYCDPKPAYINCTEMRMLFNSGSAVYRDDIATRDVNNLKQVLLQF